MKSQFPGYYRPTKNEFAQLWADCVFVVDANILLNLYRYSPGTSQHLIELLKRVQSRLWIPHQAATEYHKNRLKVIGSETKAYSDAIKTSKNLVSSLNADSYRNHPFADPAITKSTLYILKKLEDDLNQRMKNRENFIIEDPLKERIAEIFEGRVGSPLTEEREKELLAVWEQRFSAKVPPGYADSKKQEGRGVNDLRIWFQIIDWAKENQQDIVFITDDRKEDWWLEYEGKTLSPRPELVEEIHREATVRFHMYKPAQFMRQATEYLNSTLDNTAVSEAITLTNTFAHKAEALDTTDIPPRYKAVRKFVQQYQTVCEILQVYENENIEEYGVTGEPELLPNSLIEKMEKIFQEEPQAFSAIQAIHSLQADVLHRHFKRCKIDQAILNDALLVNSLPGYFVRFLSALKNGNRSSNDSALKVLELQKYLAARKSLSENSA